MEDKATSLRTRLMVEMPSDNDLRAEGMSAAATPARAAAGLASVLSVLWAASGVSTAISASEKVASASENDALALSRASAKRTCGPLLSTVRKPSWMACPAGDSCKDEAASVNKHAATSVIRHAACIVRRRSAQGAHTDRPKRVSRTKLLCGCEKTNLARCETDAHMTIVACVRAVGSSYV